MLSLIGLIAILIRVLQILFIARFVAQLLDQAANNPITRFLIDTTDPILAPVRRILPPTGPIDFSPTVMLIGLELLRYFLITRM